MVHRRTSCALDEQEMGNLMKEQQCIKSLFVTGEFDEGDDEGEQEEKSIEKMNDNLGLDEIQEEEEEEGVQPKKTQVKCIPPPQDVKKERSKSTKIALGNIKAKLMRLKLRSRLDMSNDGVLGVQAEENNDNTDNSLPLMKSVASHRNRQRSSILAPPSAPPTRKQRSSIFLPPTHRRCSISSSNYRGSIVDENFVKYNMNMKLHCADVIKEEDEEDKDRKMEVECVDYVRKPDLANILEQYDAMANHPKYS